jgi:hypothetical protein
MVKETKYKDKEYSVSDDAAFIGNILMEIALRLRKNG